LNENGYLNDEDFIREFVAAKSKFKNWSSKRIKSELIKRGITEKNIELILNKMNINADVENAMIQAKKRYKSLSKRKLEPKELRNKLAAFLFSKGFDYDLIKDVCEKIFKTKIEE
jgi:regulatory protein